MKTKYEIFSLKARQGKRENIDYIMKHLTAESNLFITRLVDFSLGLVESEEGINRIKHYLFEGSLIQRNYSALVLNRMDEWKSVQKAYKLGLVDEIQTFAR